MWHKRLFRQCASVGECKAKYSLLDSAVKSVDGPLFFDEHIHVAEPFQNNMQRLRFIQDLQISIPVDVYRFSPGGSHITVVCIVPMPADRTLDTVQTDTGRTVARIKDYLPQFHTRQMHKQFKLSLANIVTVSPKYC